MAAVTSDLTFCTLMLWLVLLKIKLAFMALANRLAYAMVRSGLSRKGLTLTWIEISS